MRRLIINTHRLIHKHSKLLRLHQTPLRPNKMTLLQTHPPMLIPIFNNQVQTTAISIIIINYLTLFDKLKIKYVSGLVIPVFLDDVEDQSFVGDVDVVQFVSGFVFEVVEPAST